MERIKLVVVAMVFVVGAGCGSSGGVGAVVIGESVAADLAALADDTFDVFAGAAPAAVACMGEVRLEADPSLDDLAKYDQAGATIYVRVPANAASLEGSLIHEFGHHLEASCASHAELRPVFLAAQGHPADTPWFADGAWENKPSEQYAEAVVEVTLGRRRRSRLEIQLTPAAVAVTRNWLQTGA